MMSRGVPECDNTVMRWLCVVPVMCMLALPLAAADLTKIKVVVNNERGKPVDRASVVVKFVGGRSLVKLGRKIKTSWEMRSSQEGVVEVPELPKGKVLVQVIAKGYQTFGDTFEITEDERTIEISLARPQKQFSAHE